MVSNPVNFIFALLQTSKLSLEFHEAFGSNSTVTTRLVLRFSFSTYTKLVTKGRQASSVEPFEMFSYNFYIVKIWKDKIQILQKCGFSVCYLISCD